MAYKKISYKRKRTYGKRRTYRGRKRSINAMIYRAINKNIEMKVRQYAYSAVGYNVTGGATSDFSSISYGSSSVVAGLCSGIANGTGEGQRVGNKIKLKGVYINMAFQPGDNSNYVRLLLVEPIKQVDVTSTSAFVQQLLSNQGSSGTQWLQPVDTDVHRVHMDKRFWFQFAPVDGSTATQVARPHFVRKFIKFSKNVLWQLSAPVVPSREVYLVALSDSAAVANPGAIAGFVKLYYQDG